MTARSSGNLYQPLKVGSGHLQRLDDFMWPSYRRVTLEQGGDHYADFIIAADDQRVTEATLERWFMTWIGCHFVESFAGQTAFMGYVNKMTLYVGGVARTISLENMYNHVRVVYQPSSDSAAATTSAASDSTSIATYGTKQAIIETREYTKSTHATTIRDNYLARWKQPRTWSGDLVPNEGAAVLEIYVEGYIKTLDWTYYQTTNDDKSDTTLSSHITSSLISGADFVTTGDVTTVSTSITTEADFVTPLNRIDSLLEGLEYSYGCFGGRAFDLKAQDFSNIKYRRQAYSQRQGFLRGGQYVPEPLVTPSGWVFTEDVFGGVPQSADLRDDFRADWIAAVEYSQDGVVLLNGEEPDDAWSADAVKLAYALEVGETVKEPKMYWIGGRDAVKG